MSVEFIPFNPLDTKNLAASIAEAMLTRKAYPLGKIPDFKGAGIYAIYYSGNFPPYAEIAKRNADGRLTAPIYVGKAIPSGARKGGGAGGASNGKSLLNRLTEHATSIAVASNLEISDFFCRFLVVEDIWIPLGESLLIARHAPVWNSLVDGFGNHDPGKGRYEGLRPRWDLVHPGRLWALKCKKREETAEDIHRDIEAYLRTAPYPTSEWLIDAEEEKA